MTLTERVKSIFGRNSRNLPSPNGAQVGGRLGFPDKAGYMANVAHGYNRNPVVASCVGIYASTLNEAPLCALYDDKTVNSNHPVSLLFRRPNPRMGQAEFWQIVWTYLGIGGNAYILKVRSAMGNIVELYPYSDAHVSPLLDDMGWVYAYRYQSQGVLQDWPAADVIHIQNPAYRDPLAMHKGISPINVAWDKITTYNELSATIYSLVASNAVPSGILSAPGELPPTTVEALKQQLRKRKDAQGKERTDPLVLGSGMSYTQMGLDAERLQAIEIIQELETAICSAFRIHPAVVLTSAGLARSTYNNMASAYAEYTTLTRVPFWNALEEQLEAGLSREFPNTELAFDLSYVQALQPDVDSVIYPVIAQYNANVVTLNEVRNKLGYDPDDDGDVYQYERLATIAGPPLLSASAGDFKTDADIVEGVEGDRVKWIESKAVEYWRTQEKVIETAATETAKDAADMFREMQRVVSKAVKAPEDAINVKDLVTQFMTANRRTQDKLRAQIIELAMQSVDGDLSQVQSFIDQIRDEQIRKTTQQMTESVDTARSDVARVLEANAGQPVDVIQAALEKKFTELTTSRANMIARTTCKSQASVVQNKTVERMNARETNPKRQIVQVWLSQRDDSVRETHEELDGKYIEAGQTFDKFVPGAGAGPGLGIASEAINCRCTLRPVRKERLAS